MKFRVILLTLLLLSFFEPAIASHFCTIRPANLGCDSTSQANYSVYRAYNYSNSHVNFTGSDSDNYVQCCSFIQTTTLQSASIPSCPANQANLFDSYQNNNSHVARPGTLSDSDNYRVCGRASYDILDCTYQTNNRTAPQGYAALIHTNQTLNSHAEMTNLSSISQTPSSNYNNTVFCKLNATAPTLTGLIAVDRFTLRLFNRDESQIEKRFDYYGDVTPNATTYFGNNTSTTVPTTGTVYVYDWGSRTPNTTYYVRSRSFDEHNTPSFYSNELKRSTNASVPINLKIKTINDSALNISWEPDGNPSNTIYTMYRGILNVSGDINQFLCITTKTWCVDTGEGIGGLRTDFQYCYKAYAMNSEFVNSTNSTSNCGSTSFTTAHSLNAHFDPDSMFVPKDGFVKTYLFVRNTGNVPDRFTVTFNHNPEEIDVIPKDPVMDIPANSWSRIEVTVNARTFSDIAQMNATVRSIGDPSKVESAIFELKLVEIIGIPGLANIGVLILALLAGLVIFKA